MFHVASVSWGLISLYINPHLYLRTEFPKQNNLLVKLKPSNVWLLKPSTTFYRGYFSIATLKSPTNRIRAECISIVFGVLARDLFKVKRPRYKKSFLKILNLSIDESFTIFVICHLKLLLNAIMKLPLGLRKFDELCL